MRQQKARTRWRASVTTQRQARALRDEMTATERQLWSRLRGRQVLGAHFRKQHAVGPFIVDFFCPRSKLVIERDGDTHEDREAYDAMRSRWLTEQRGYRVIRFTNDDVFEDLDAVVEAISEAL